MQLSVVIPTRDRPQMLTDCLETLSTQDQAPQSTEVLVVDDGSSSSLEPIVSPFAKDGLRVRCVRQPKSGLSAARNKGILETHGDVIAFLDDDTLVSPRWTAAIHQGFRRERCQVLGGRITLRFEGDIPRWLSEKRHGYLSRYDLGPFPRELRNPPLPFGANFAMTREVVESMGPFDEGLGRAGGQLISNEETELLRRILAAGGRIVYWPEAAVQHRVPADRLTKDWFRQRAFAQGVSDMRTSPLDDGSYPVLLAREFIRATRAAPILVRRLVECGSGFDALLWLISSRGRILELNRRHRQGHV
jgi:glycosyltransferase involved in cell wall biosynthesis